MRFADAIDAVRHAAYRATITGHAWGIYSLGGSVVAAPVGTFSASQLLEVCRP